MDDDRLRILWVFPPLSPQLQRVAEKLARHPDISLEVMSPIELPAPLSQLVSHTPLTCRHKLDLGAQQRIRGKLRDTRFDIVHAYTSRNLANVIGACRGVQPPPEIVGYRGSINRLRVLDPANWMTFWHPRVAKIICVCQATERALIESRISDTKVETVWEGCEANSLLPESDCNRAQFGIPEDAFVVGTVANMRPVKGVDLLLRAAQQLADKRDIYWLLIGDVLDSRIAQLAADTRIADRVILAGPRQQGGRFVGLFDVYAAPSRMEGLSMSIMEAMTKQACCVVSDVGGNVELIRHEREGLVVPTEDSAELARALLRLHDEPSLRKRLAANAYRRVTTEFTISAWTQRLVGLYRNVATRPAMRLAS
jgi:glycosyltransferase involved in cell wall biosynthesis